MRSKALQALGEQEYLGFDLRDCRRCRGARGGGGSGNGCANGVALSSLVGA